MIRPMVCEQPAFYFTCIQTGGLNDLYNTWTLVCSSYIDLIAAMVLVENPNHS